VSSEAPDPELEILREAERRRGGCGAFIVAMLAFALALVVPMFFPHEIMVLFGMQGDPASGLFLVCRIGFAIALAIVAAKGFTKLRLRLTGKTSPPAPPNSSENLNP
jgi:hypothetical protein